MMEKYKTQIIPVIGIVGVLLAVFLFVETRYTLKQTSALQPTKTITVSGSGKVEKAPDMARVSFTIEDTKKTLADSQKEVSTKVDAVQKALGDAGIPAERVKTDSYATYPEYTYSNVVCITYPCPQPTPTLKGYKVSHSITVEIQDLTKIETVLGAIGKVGVTNITGPNLGFADDKVVAREARDKAIEDAQKEAKKLAKSLGVKLGAMVSFSEQGGAMPLYMSARSDMALGASMAKQEVSLPQGVQKVESTVSITYEIR